MDLPSPVVDVDRLAVDSRGSRRGRRSVPEESAISLTYNHAAYAVMMISPMDIIDFGIGFTLNEGLINEPAEVSDIELYRHELGLELRMTLIGAAADRTAERRRRIAGPVGCGLCGIESLTEALRLIPTVKCPIVVTRQDVLAAIASLAEMQMLNRETRAVHAAGFYRPGTKLLIVREDVGRHNAVDKLAGALARSRQSTDDGLLVISSRVSIELVQKAAMMGVGVMVAMSAPTALAVRVATAAGITLIAVARDDGFEIFSQAQRVHT